MFKSNGGFTLVELIVVIAILGILACITVPAYSQYVNKAKDVQATVNAAYNDGVADANDVWNEAFGSTAFTEHNG